MIDLKTAPLLTRIKQTGQKYHDRPVYIESRGKELAKAVGRATGTWIPKDIKELTHYERTPLVWK